jgi:hypothetical protein
VYIHSMETSEVRVIHRAINLSWKAVLVTTLFITESITNAQVIPGDAQPTCTVDAGTFAGWFQSGSPSLDGVVNPANSVAFPNTPNCSFYQWAMQMFLWMTSPAPPSYGGGGGRIFDSPTFFDVSPPDASNNRTFVSHSPSALRLFSVRVAQRGSHDLPVVIDKAGRLLEVEHPTIGSTGKRLIRDQQGKLVEFDRVEIGKSGKASFLDRAGKAIVGSKPVLHSNLSKTLTVQRFMVNGKPVFIDGAGNVVELEQGQAGTDGVLETQNNSLVYYAIVTNDVYAYFLTCAKDGDILPPPTVFPTTQPELDSIVSCASKVGKTFPDSNALTVEVKTSWVDAATLPNTQGYITLQVLVPSYDQSNPSQWVVNGQKTIQLALVGVHVVGSVAGHSEMIWATFEHFGNTPLATYSYNSTSGTKTVTQGTGGNWLFTATNSSGPFNIMHMSFVSPNIVACSPANLDCAGDGTFTISPSDTIRTKPFGAGSDTSPNPLDPTPAASNTEIISINNSIHSMMPTGDVRSNYYLAGATWTIRGAAPSGSFPTGNEVGTSKLAGSTMETYQQGNNLSSTPSNCFSCHVTNTTGVSHIFDQLQPLTFPPPPPPPDCSTLKCRPGLVCCDCTVTHCTTTKECQRECKL